MSHVNKEDIAIFREWLEKHPYLPHDISDSFIGHFLNFSKGSVERAKKTFDNYFKTQHQNIDILQNYDPLSEKSQAFDRQCAVCVLPDKTPEGCNVVVSKLLVEDASAFSVTDYFLRHDLIITNLLLESDVPYKGLEYILDFTGVTMAHLASVTPGLAETVVGGMQQSCPIRIKGIHLVGVTSFAEKVLKFFLMFMSEKMKARMKIHSGPESLRAALPPKIIPKELGGDGEELKIIYDKFYKENNLKKRDQVMKEIEVRKRESALRPNIETKAEMDGTFKRLQID